MFITLWRHQKNIIISNISMQTADIRIEQGERVGTPICNNKHSPRSPELFRFKLWYLHIKILFLHRKNLSLVFIISIRRLKNFYTSQPLTCCSDHYNFQSEHNLSAEENFFELGPMCLAQLIKSKEISMRENSWKIFLITFTFSDKACSLNTNSYLLFSLWNKCLKL